ncbi:MAG: sugar ABC transporter ATP-binding protein [Chloroflexi bacterium]|nr:sugar ABC transporter ATP-binding protein [Chloroflexota bacterium]
MNDQISPIVELRDISKRFPGVLALDNVSMNVLPGEIHAVVGENGAGKSTLMNILAGELQPDSGDIVFQGNRCAIPNPYVSQQMGISVVYQELALCPNLSIAENVSLSSASTSNALSFVKRRRFAVKAREVLSQLGITDIDPNRPISKLTVAEQQLVEIAKAISGQVKLLILDEPNSALTREETDNLFAILRQLRDSGVGMIYVSHRLEEALSLCDRITVLRDGKWIDTVAAANVTVDDLIAMMVGRAVDDLYQRATDATTHTQTIFELHDLRSGNALKGMSFALKAGEILGVAGLPGAGKDELVECCFGLRSYTGKIDIQGNAVSIHSPSEAIQLGLAFIPADRRASGALLVMDVKGNIVAANLPSVSKYGLMKQPAIRATSQKYVKELDIRIASLSQKMGTLSGGNQQKVILARGLATNPSVLILHEPTRGIDVGAKAEIYRILQDLAAEGVGVLIVSSELPELIGQCDRILVMHDGRITGQFTRDEAAEEPILACAMGQTTHF